MKRHLTWLLLTSSAILLVACSQKLNKTEDAKDTTEQTITTETKVNPEEQYVSVLEKFTKLSTSGYDVLESVVEGTEPQEAMVMNYMAETSNNGHVKQYAFYDINNDNSDELIIGDVDFISAIYTLKGNRPVFAKGAGTAAAGGMRSSLTIFRDGTLMYLSGSGTDPNWEAASYQIKDGEVVEVKKLAFTQFQGTDPAEVLGISSEKIDLKGVTWTSFVTSTPNEETTTTTEAATSSQTDVASIFSGNTAGIEGTWTNSRGETVTITAREILSHRGIQAPFEVSPFSKNTELPLLTLKTGEFNPYGDPAYIFIPAGNPAYSDNGTSDAARDRIIEASTVAQSAVISPDNFFYR